jgi:acyl-CoA synthetase (AMP-forming)/AMP-acid ligase II
MAGVPEVGFRPTVPAFMRKTTEVYGGQDFVVGPTSRLTYSEADDRSQHLARFFLCEGINKGTRVAFRFGNTPEWIVTFLALARIGAVAMPLSTMYRPAELRQVLTLGDAEVFVTPRHLLDVDQTPFLEATFPELADSSAPVRLRGAPCLRRILVVGEADRPWAEPLNLADPKCAAEWADDEFLHAVEDSVYPSDPMVVVFTSGTTAEPKAVVHSHGTWVRHTSNAADHTDEPYGIRVYAGMPFFWVGGLSTIIGTAMHRGDAILCMEKPDPDVVAEFLVREGCDRAMMWPNLRERVVARLRAGRWGTDELPAFARASDDPQPDLSRLSQSLGMTETCAAYIVSGPAGHLIPDEYKGAHGFKVPFMQYQITDPESGEALPDGAEGEICVRGYALMLGMYKKERHEYLDDDGWYHTGDRGSVRGPYVFFTGRLKDLIKSSGANVSPREVEAVLNSCDGVLTSVVVGIPDTQRQEIVGAAVVPKPGITVDAAELVAACKDRLSQYKVPRRVAVVDDADLPLVATGKPNLVAVRRLVAERGTSF